MEYLVTAAQMRQYDKNTSDYFKIPSAVLMERAALSCVDVILQRHRQMESALSQFAQHAGQRVLIAAGCGNNGGDGLAIGRLLMQEGFLVDFLLIGKEEKATELTVMQLESLRAYGCEILRTFPDREYDIIVDALFGVGLTRPLEGAFKDAVEKINGSDAWVLSVDIPSGIHADSGQVLGAAVRADVTVTFGFRKLGSFWYPGTEYAGKLICAPIGITQDSFLKDPPQIFTFTEPVTELMPFRAADGNKGTFGKAALLAGSAQMAGACILAGKGAFYSGVGMLKIVSDGQNREAVLQALPEAMFAEEIEPAALWADVIAAGPGLGKSDRAAAQLMYLIEKTKKPLILDADAINLLAERPELLNALTARQESSCTRRMLALTPHPGELARLSGCKTEEILKDPIQAAFFWAQRLNAVVLCKGARTAVASPEGRIYLNSSGNSGMATAGSGDVLTGIIAALAAVSADDMFGAVCLGVYLHGLAGDKAAHQRSSYSMTAGNIAEMIPQILLQ